MFDKVKALGAWFASFLSPRSELMAETSPTDGVQFEVYAYLAARDEDSKTLADYTFEKLQEFKQRLDNGHRVRIFMAYDVRDRAVQLFELLGDTLPPETAPLGTPGTFEHNLAAFLTFAEGHHSADRPRMLIFSSHGVAGYGISYEPLLILRNRDNWPVLDPLLSALPHIPDDVLYAPDKEVRDEEAKRLREARRYVVDNKAKLQQLGLFQASQIDTEDSLSMLRLLDQLRSIRGQGDSVESGLTHVAVAGDTRRSPDLDKLSVGQLREIIQANVTVSGNCPPFAVAVFQACALGIPEIAWELRSVAQVSLLSPILLYRGCNYADWMPALADLDLSTNAAREQFPQTAATTILPSEMNHRNTSAALLGSQEFRPDHAVSTTHWPAFLAEFQSWTTRMRIPATATPHPVATAYSASHNFCHPGCNPCSRNLVDLKHFLLGLNPHASLSSTLGTLQVPLLSVQSFAKANANLICHCQANGGLSLYFPQNRAQFELLPEYNDTTFAWLALTRWHEFLDEYLP